LMPNPRIEFGGEPLACCVHAAAMKQIVSDGRRPVGTVALDDDTGLFEELVWCMPFDCGQHQTKAAAIEAIQRVSGVFSVWDM
jgi:hypothetical protein